MRVESAAHNVTGQQVWQREHQPGEKRSRRDEISAPHPAQHPRGHEQSQEPAQHRAVHTGDRQEAGAAREVHLCPHRQALHELRWVGLDMDEGAVVHELVGRPLRHRRDLRIVGIHPGPPSTAGRQAVQHVREVAV